VVIGTLEMDKKKPEELDGLIPIEENVVVGDVVDVDIVTVGLRWRFSFNSISGALEPDKMDSSSHPEKTSDSIATDAERDLTNVLYSR
jgi:hypothetical protein